MALPPRRAANRHKGGGRDYLEAGHSRLGLHAEHNQLTGDGNQQSAAGTVDCARAGLMGKMPHYETSGTLLSDGLGRIWKIQIPTTSRKV